jgi:hypothetical protein
MKGSIAEVELQRARWAAYRRGQGLVADAGGEFARGGLGRQVDDLGMRVLFLPADPEAHAVQLTAEVLSWLKEPRPGPYGGQAPS